MSLMEQPHALLIPVLSPSAFPAVFERSGEHALVWGERGWAWIRLFAGGPTVAAFDHLLNAAIEQSERSAAAPVMAGGACLHKGRLVVVDPQEVHAAPSDASAVVSTIPARWPAKKAHWDGLVPAADAVRESAQIEPVLRVVERRGDWARVILPDRMPRSC
jgi:hypothetical protein